MRAVPADAILIVHFLFVLFVAGGLLFIWIGAWRGWRWVRNRRFRYAHLAAILFVASESLLGVACPLTTWENTLRGVAGNMGNIGDQSFVAHWVHQLMFFSAPEWVFTTLHVGFALLVAATFWLVPFHRKKGADITSAP
jgi:Protein of Unknown function (DUF2784)